jgi:ATP-dependent Lon protease
MLRMAQEKTTEDSLVLIYFRDRFLFPKCTIKVPAHYAEGVSLAKGERVVVYTPVSFFGKIFLRGNVATAGEVLNVSELSNGIVEAEIKGERRIIISKHSAKNRVQVSEIPVKTVAGTEELTERLRKRAQEFVFLVNVTESDRLIYLMIFMNGIQEITDFISHYFIIDIRKSKRLYCETDPLKRGKLLEQYLGTMITRLRTAVGRTQ